MTAGQFCVVQASPDMLHVPVPVAGQLAFDVQEVPETLQVPATSGQFALVVQAALLTLHLPPVIGQLLGEAVHAAPPAMPPQRLAGEQVPDGQAAPVRSQVRPVFGQAVDSAIFYPIAFLGVWETHDVLLVLVTNWGMKVAWEVVLTPVTYAVVGWLKGREGVDVFDTGTEFSPFAKAESV